MYSLNYQFIYLKLKYSRQKWPARDACCGGGERREDECDMGQGVEKKAPDTDFDEENNTEYVSLLQHKYPTNV